MEEERAWYYRDLDGKIWGPFKREQMSVWFAQKKLSPNLPVSVRRGGPFYPIQQLGVNLFDEIPMDVIPEVKRWWYKVKLSDTVFGPFATEAMRSWYVNKKLPETLLVSWISPNERSHYVPLFVFPSDAFAWEALSPTPEIPVTPPPDAPSLPEPSTSYASRTLSKPTSSRRLTTFLEGSATKDSSAPKRALAKASSSRRLTTFNGNSAAGLIDEEEKEVVDSSLKAPKDATHLRSPGPILAEASKDPSTIDWAKCWRRELLRSFDSVVPDVRDWAGLSWQGACPWRPKPNQDRAVTFQCDETRSFVAAVFDGHGPVGHLVSDYVTRNFERAIKSDASWRDDVEATLRRVIPAIDRDLAVSSEIDCKLSGTTVIVAVVRNGRVTIANVGDSSLSAVVRNDDRIASTTMVQISKDHTPEDADERDRIIASGGLVYAIDPDGNGPQGPVRVWRKQRDGPGIAMSRSVGDSMASGVGVICTPEVKTMTLAEIAKSTGHRECVGLLLASDALYEFMDGSQAAKAGRLSAMSDIKCDLSQLMKGLAQTIQRQWTTQENGYVDDTTLVLLRFA